MLGIDVCMYVQAHAHIPSFIINNYEDVAKMASTVSQTLEKDRVLHVLYIFTKAAFKWQEVRPITISNTKIVFLYIF